MRDIRVIEEWILVKPDKTAAQERVTEAGVVIPAQVNEKKEVVKRATVVQISKDVPRLLKKEKDDPDAELQYGIGDVILFYGKTGIPIENGEYMFLKYDGMLAIETTVPDEEEDAAF